MPTTTDGTSTVPPEEDEGSAKVPWGMGTKFCSVDGCPKFKQAQMDGMCRAHYLESQGMEAKHYSVKKHALTMTDEQAKASSKTARQRAAEEGSSGHAPAPTSSSSTAPRYFACQGCHRAHVKCHRSRGRSETDPCDRCTRIHKECVPYSVWHLRQKEQQQQQQGSGNNKKEKEEKGVGKNDPDESNKMNVHVDDDELSDGGDNDNEEEEEEAAPTPTTASAKRKYTKKSDRWSAGWSRSPEGAVDGTNANADANADAKEEDPDDQDIGEEDAVGKGNDDDGEEDDDDGEEGGEGQEDQEEQGDDDDEEEEEEEDDDDDDEDEEDNDNNNVPDPINPLINSAVALSRGRIHFDSAPQAAIGALLSNAGHREREYAYSWNSILGLTHGGAAGLMGDDGDSGGGSKNAVGTAALAQYLADQQGDADGSASSAAPTIVAPTQVLELIRTVGHVPTCRPPAGSGLVDMVCNTPSENALWYGTGSGKKRKDMGEDEDEEIDRAIRQKTASALGKDGNEEAQDDGDLIVPYTALTRLYETLCQQDATVAASVVSGPSPSSSSRFRTECRYMTAPAVVERLRHYENEGAELERREREILAAGKEMGLFDDANDIGQDDVVVVGGDKMDTDEDEGQDTLDLQDMALLTKEPAAAAAAAAASVAQ